MYPTIFVTLLLCLSHVVVLALAPRQQPNATSKAGLAWANGDTVDIEQFATTGKVSWYYSWSHFPTDSTLEYVPMLWGYKDVDDFSRVINSLIDQRQVKAVLGMNEPEQKGQSNMTPAEGAQMWKTYLQPLRSQRPGLRLGSPAPSSAPVGKDWVQQFLGNCSDSCTVDFIALHWYGVNASAMIDYVTDFHNAFQRPIWVTEWACQNFVDLKAQCSHDDVVLFMNKTQTFMDEADFVERYAWFGAMKDMSGVNQDDALMDSAGKINQLGEQYIGSQPPQTSSSSAGNPDGPPSGGEGSHGGGATIANKDSPLLGISSMLFALSISLPFII